MSAWAEAQEQTRAAFGQLTVRGSWKHGGTGTALLAGGAEQVFDTQLDFVTVLVITKLKAHAVKVQFCLHYPHAPEHSVGMGRKQGFSVLYFHF